MTDEHERYERLVVGHVLDDLVAPDAALFRSHLMGCADCRARVAELRGIEAQLAEVEAAERERAQVRTQVPGRVVAPDTQIAVGSGRITIRHVTAATILVALLATAMGFWNLHLRTLAETYLTVAEARGETLAGLADGAPLALDLSSGVTGVAATHGTEVSLALSQLAPLASDERLIAWWLDGTASIVPPVLLAGPGRGDQDTTAIAVTIEDPGAGVLVVTRERGAPGRQPAGVQVLRAELEDVGRAMGSGGP